MNSAWRPLAMAAIVALAGCGRSEPVRFSNAEELESEHFGQNPRVRAVVASTVDELFGATPYMLRVPEGANLPEGGRYLAPFTMEEGREGPAPVAYVPAGEDRPVHIEGGQSLYKRHCIHCHGLTGDGEGPTAPFLYPRPRDYRQGKFKFTSTSGDKPTRDDFRRTINLGIHGTSMPPFHAQLTPQEIEQVIDYVLFLSMRGEAERILIEEGELYTDADMAEEADVEEFGELATDYIAGVFRQWSASRDDGSVFRPMTPRVPPTDRSIERGRLLFLGMGEVKLECAGCHGPQAQGNGPSWIEPEVFDRLVFTFDPEDPAYIEELAATAGDQKRWGDEWGDPLRPANLNHGVYKGGRRPIDIYWRIATGIPGSGMPAHDSALRATPEDLWHLVNFVLALPERPELLRPEALRAIGFEGAPEATVATATVATLEGRER